MTKEGTKLVLVCGLPGSGKTTLAKKMSEELQAIRLCPDDWMDSFDISLWDENFRSKLEKRLWEFGQELLTLGQNVVLEYGLWAKSERDEKVQGARRIGVKVELYFLDPPLEELRRRLEGRGMKEDAEIITKLDGYSNTLQRPDENELKKYDSYSIL